MAAAEQLEITKELTDDAKQRLADCRKQKDIFALDIEECYFFAAPQRHRSVRSTGSLDATRPDDAAEASTTLAREVAEDFATEVEASFLTDEWARFKPGFEVDEDQLSAETKTAIETHTKQTHKAIKASNFKAAFAATMVPDGAVGTVAMHIDDTKAPGPFQCQAVPLRELEINVGPDGEVDDRFWVQTTRHRHLKAKLPGIDLPKDVAAKVKDKPNHKCVIRWGWWRDWSDMSTETWNHVVMVGDAVVKAVKLTGPGSCALVVGRFNPDPMFAFGNGPMIKSLPDLRTLDESMALMMERFDLAVHPPFGYPNDGTVNFEGGIQPGMAYPMERGSGQDFVKLFFEGDADLSFVVEAGLERRIRRSHHADRPEQRGDTPPTATQWLDEMVMAQRRIAIPAASFWGEFCAATFLRFNRLLSDRGRLQPIEINGAQLMLEPYNPAEKAKEQQEVQVAVRMLEIIMQFFPEIGQALVEAEGTISALKEKMGDRLVKLNSKEQMAQTIGLMAQVAGAGQGDVPGAEQVPA
jgi:hypothetical protein